MEEQNLNRPSRAVNDFDLQSFFKKYTRYWWIFVISFFLAFGVAKYYNWYKNPEFAITAKLLVKDENVGKDRLLQQLDIDKPSKNIENEIEIILSHNLLAKALSQLDFDVSYYLLGDLKVSEVYKDCPFYVEIEQLDFQAYYQEFFVDLIDGESYRLHYTLNDEYHEYTGSYGEVIDMGLGSVVFKKRDNFPHAAVADPAFDKKKYRISFNTIASNQHKYLSKLQISPARAQSTILQIYLIDEVPLKGLDFVNALIGVYLENDIDVKNKAASATAVFLDEQLETITDDLENIERNKENYKVAKGIVDLESESQMVLESIKEIDGMKAVNAARLTMIDQMESYILNNLDLRDLAPASLDIDDPLLVRLVNKLSELQSQREIIVNESTVKDPKLGPLNAEIQLTRTTLLENIRNIKKGLERKDSEFESTLGSYKNRIERIPTTERELLEIERKFRIQESLYVFLLEKRAELAISLAATESDTRIIDSARVLPGPISPVPQRAYSIALFLALVVPLAGIFAVEKLNDKVTEVGMLKRITDIPLLGVVRFNRNKDSLVTIDKPRSSIAEEYRSIRTNLQFFGDSGGPKIIMVTSSIGTEGKTFTAMNLAAVMAASGARTILVGLDLRKPRIVEDFGIDNKIGCSNYLSGNAKLEDIVQHSGVLENLFILPSGPTPPNPSELILSNNMAQLISELKKAYDCVIIDTPPIGLVSDGLILSKHADSVIFVVRDGVTRKGHLVQVNELYHKKQFKDIGFVFNAVRRRNMSYGYNSGYGYVYGSDYGDYFDDKELRNGISKWFRPKRTK